MSYNNKKASRKIVTTTPFCTVCFNAGKSEAEYRSHYVKSEVNSKASGSSGATGSIVVCPLIKSIECRYCHNTGHTVKYCSMLKDREKNKGKDNKQKKSAAASLTSYTDNKKQQPTVNKTATTGGYFNNLMNDDEVEVESTHTAAPQVTVSKCWAEVVAQTPPYSSASQVQQANSYTQAQSQPEAILVTAEVAEVAEVVVKNVVIHLPPPPPTPVGFSFPKISREISWADYTSDSDDDVY